MAKTPPAPTVPEGRFVIQDTDTDTLLAILPLLEAKLAVPGIGLLMAQSFRVKVGAIKYVLKERGVEL